LPDWKFEALPDFVIFVNFVVLTQCPCRVLATFDACLPSAVLVRFGKWAIVRLRFAAAAAFFMFRRAAVRWVVGIQNLL